MVMSYTITIALSLLIANVFVFITLQAHYLQARKDILLAYSRNVIDSAIEKDTGSAARLKKSVEMASIRADAQVIVVNKAMTIVEDSYHRLVYTQYVGPMDITPVLYRGKELTNEYIVNGDRKLYIALPVEGDTDIPMAVVMFCSMKDIYKEIYSISRDLAIISCFLVVIFGLFSHVIFARITNPIKKLTSAIQSMAEGSLDQHVDVTGNNEIASLCNSFNNMNGKINSVDKQRRQFVADASHELKSPLASIKVLVQSLMGGGIENKEIASEFLGDIDQEVDRLSDIVGSLLELTKLEGSYGVKVEKFNIGILCRDVIAKLHFIAKTKNIKIESELNDFIIEGNRENIFRAVYNILENAIKYSPKGGKINVEICKDEFVRIKIQDRGPGIPEDEIGRIFDRFYRVDKTRARKTGGSGLGLSIAMEIIKQHKGSIEVQSKVGEGSLFIISLPYIF